MKPAKAAIALTLVASVLAIGSCSKSKRTLEDLKKEIKPGMTYGKIKSLLGSEGKKLGPLKGGLSDGAREEMGITEDIRDEDLIEYEWEIEGKPYRCVFHEGRLLVPFEWDPNPARR